MKYDRQIAIQQATKVFWQLGFQGSKMRDLQTQMNMRPGSIYAGFGSKEGLFKEVIELYVQQNLDAIEQGIERSKSQLLGLKQFVKGQFSYDDTLQLPPTCLLIKTATELEESEPELAELARNGMRAVANQFEIALERAKQNGEVSSSMDSNRVAKWLQMQIIGLRIYANGLASKKEVSLMVEDIFESLKLQGIHPA